MKSCQPTDRKTNRSADWSTDRPGHGEVSLSSLFCLGRTARRMSDVWPRWRRWSKPARLVHPWQVYNLIIIFRREAASTDYFVCPSGVRCSMIAPRRSCLDLLHCLISQSMSSPVRKNPEYAPANVRLLVGPCRRSVGPILHVIIS